MASNSAGRFVTCRHDPCRAQQSCWANSMVIKTKGGSLDYAEVNQEQLHLMQARISYLMAMTHL